MPKLTESLKKAQEAPSNQPVWKGPEEDGVTQSLLSRFLVCRERFRLLVVEGLKPADQFNHRLEFGQMWHTCEESFAVSGNPIVNNPVANPPWLKALTGYCQGLVKRYPTSQEQIEKWYQIIKRQFPIYIDYWKKHPDVKNRTPLLQEQTFDIPYKLPSGRIVRLRGKWDSVDLVGKGRQAKIYLQENKTKGDINEEQVKRQLSFDLQTMIYLVALTESMDMRAKVGGVRYNVIRRPLAGGKHSIKPLAGKTYKSKPDVPPESPTEFYDRLAGLISSEPEFFFMRWKAEVTPGDLERFRRECLDPILEGLCDWWYYVSRENRSPWEPDYPSVMGRPGVVAQHQGVHWRHPYGVWNALNEGGSTDLDEYLETGSTAGLQRVDRLFEELD